MSFKEWYSYDNAWAILRRGLVSLLLAGCLLGALALADKWNSKFWIVLVIPVLLTANNLSIFHRFKNKRDGKPKPENT